jgi:hypothetical protein
MCEPCSTYPVLSGIELRNRIFLNKKDGKRAYFEFKELMMMYQVEIKKRWENRA